MNEKHRALLRDYVRSGFDRGHNVPVGNVSASELVVPDTFYLSNISPQVGKGFNRDYWARLEQFCRRLAEHWYGDRCVCCFAA